MGGLILGVAVSPCAVRITTAPAPPPAPAPAVATESGGVLLTEDGKRIILEP